MLAVLVAAIAIIAPIQIRASEEEDEYARQVLEENRKQEQEHDNFHNEDSYYEKQEQQRLDAQERAAQEAADRKASERERKFENELDNIRDEEQRKLALKQKKKDGRQVRSVLKAAKRNNLYAVMGIHNHFSLKTQPYPINIAGVAKFTIPGITFWKGPTEQQIKKQFRKRAIQIHPDKNKDGRAEEAFVAVQNAASILSDPKLRQQYDAERKLARSEQWNTSKTLASKALVSVWAVLRKMLGVCQKLLGPFFVPVMIIGALII